ncbi:MAG: hypothetical protein P9L99_12285 [Candidatus Lernaella stagnicola]|nr:hypothetical protein [Candidatus Lernaella stagnicola]
MPNLNMVLLGLIGLTYLMLLGVAITGALQLVQRDNKSLRAIHRWSAVPAVVFWALVHVVAIFIKSKMLVTFLLFLALVFAGALTGWLVKPGWRRAMHIVLGVATFLLFTLFIFVNLMTAA